MARKKDAGGKRTAGKPFGEPMAAVVVELPPFTLRWGQYRLTERDRTAMLEAIFERPGGMAGPEGYGGRPQGPIRFAGSRPGAGGGYRVFYAVFRKYGKVVLITVFPKNEQANLSRAGQNLVARMLREIETELEQIAREDEAGAREQRR